ncbi:PAX-interacting protein 1 [Acipenser ruthenus]|uniref:PAX-interacting protein 1 n=1 Tax=Acipenser ruthenus TaxID=7906 RepID=A0A662YNG1_ACIRT|nr:PAX-interacting protein 1 [Acipenser ruthenus]
MSDEELKVPEELFKDVKFYVVGDIEQKVVQLLKSGKAKEVSYNALATHIIAVDGDNPEVGEAREVFDLPVVKISSEDRNTLWALITFYGGDCQLSLNKKCTHLIVLEPAGEKYECALKHSSIKIVTPDWVLDSVVDKSRKEEETYHPRLNIQEEEEEESEEEEYDRGSQSDGSYIENRSRKYSPASSREGSPVSSEGFSPKQQKRSDRLKSELMFDDSSDSSPEKQERNLNWTPAEVPQSVAAKHRLPHGKDSGLINLCANVPPAPGSIVPQEARSNLCANVAPGSALPSEARSNLCANVPPAPGSALPLEARSNLVPSGQSAQGPERQEMMASWSPAVRTLRNITNNADIQQASRPSNVAHSFSLVPEHSFLVGCIFSIADYPEQMSDKQLLATWKRALREGKRCVTAHWLNTILKKKKMVPPHRTLHFPFAFPPGGKPCSQHIISVTGFVDTDRDDLKLMAYLAGAKYTGYLCRSNTVLICKEPSGLKYEKAKEWRIPCVNAQWLCDILLGNFEALRQIQHSRYSVFSLQDPLAPNQHLVSNLLAAWRIPLKISQELLMSLRLHPKQKPNEHGLQPPAKKQRVEDLPLPSKKLPPESTPAMLFTGFEPAQVQQYAKKLYFLGGELAENAQKCTHLIASKVTRTVKFLTAMSIVKHIVTPEWLEESFKSQQFADEQNFMLRDAEAEVLFCFSLEESLKRAHAAPLFKGKFFYITPGICPSLTTMKAIVECAGGKMLTKQPSFRKIMEHKQNKVPRMKLNHDEAKQQVEVEEEEANSSAQRRLNGLRISSTVSEFPSRDTTLLNFTHSTSTYTLGLAGPNLPTSTTLRTPGL